MFSKELEEVIEATLADGVITEKKRAMLHKLAQAEGVDSDVLDVVIDGRLAKMNKATMRKCPNCGAFVETGAVKCTECGHLFTGIAANNSATELANRLKEIEEKYAKQITDLHKDSTDFEKKSAEEHIWESDERRKNREDSEYRLLKQTEENRKKEITNTILNFPTPTTKEDLLDFILSLQPKAEKGGADEEETKAYRTKYYECINKAKFLFGDDPQFQSLFKRYEKDGIKKWIKKIIKTLLTLGAIVIIIILFLLFGEELDIL